MKNSNAVQMPPSYDQVLVYFLAKGIPEVEARDFFLFYDGKNWLSSSGKMYQSWKSIAHHWIVGVIKYSPWLLDRSRN